MVVAVVAVAVLAAGGGLLALHASRGFGADPSRPSAQPVVATFLDRWRSGDYAGMYALLAPSQRARLSLQTFTSEYTRDDTLAGVTAVRPSNRFQPFRGHLVTTVAVRTRKFGWLVNPLSVPVVLVRGRFYVLWGRVLAFPGLQPGGRLVRRVLVPKTRGLIRAEGGAILAEGPATDRVYPQGAPFALITGDVKPPATRDEIAARVAAGWPATQPYGQAGLEQTLDRILAGTPSFELAEVDAKGVTMQILGSRAGVPPHNVTTTLRPTLQADAIDALGGHYGGVVVLNPATGAVLADAGLGMDVIQPPGSTFKMVTASAALASHKFTPASTFAYAHYVLLDGWRLHNFHSELCGGSLVEAFAVSCNSVFAPVADAVGAKAMLAMADRYGFNRAPGLSYPAPTSVFPNPTILDDDLMVGESGIGQGGVEASPLQMATVAETIGNLGIDRPPHIVLLPHRASDVQRPHRVIPVSVAEDLRTMMEAVVNYGTGISAQLPGVQVAGKTGTSQVGSGPSDAWFAAFAPAYRPQYVVCVLVIRGGVGGATAAPIARQVLADALGIE
jgi:hypothetical protein